MDFDSRCLRQQHVFCASEAETLIRANIDVARALTSALVEKGQLLGEEDDRIIADTIAKRQLEQEDARRAEWRRREDNARAFEAKRT